jgi:putative acyl-CoA dehydrogenase
LLAGLTLEAGDLPGGSEAALLVGKSTAEADARIAVGRLALLAAAAALKSCAPAPVAEIFARTRLAATRATLYGAADIDAGTTQLLLQRALLEP